MIRACDGHHGHGETGCGFSTSTWPSGECPMCGGAMIDAPVPAPPAPRRPVAGWVEFAGNYYLTSGEAFARVNGGGAWTLYAGRFTPKSWQTKGGRAIRDWRKATDVDAGKCAAEDALRAVLVDAAAVLGMRVVP